VDLDLLHSGNFKATSNLEDIRDFDVAIICVPTPLNSHLDPDLSMVEVCSTRSSFHISRGSLVILESTSFPGTTRNIVGKILSKSGLTVGIDFDLAFSSERIDPGNKQYSIRNTPKVVAGINHRSGIRVQKLYSSFC
jgi:nucleotide sugar dehydrogenase